MMAVNFVDQFLASLNGGNDGSSSPIEKEPPAPLTAQDCYSVGLLGSPVIWRREGDFLASYQSQKKFRRLTSLKVHGSLCTIPMWPPKVEALEISDPEGQLDRVGKWPASLKYLKITGVSWTKMPSLPRSLRVLILTETHLETLPQLSRELRWLEAPKNQLRKTPTLPNLLQHLDLRGNYLELASRLEEPSFEDPEMLEYLAEWFLTHSYQHRKKNTDQEVELWRKLYEETLNEPEIQTFREYQGKHSGKDWLPWEEMWEVSL